MQHTTEYKIIEKTTALSLQEEVNKQLLLGWILLGHATPWEHNITQTLVKYSAV